MTQYDQLPVDEKMLDDFLSLSPERRLRLRERMNRLSMRRGLTYQERPGVTEPLRLIPLPATLPASQVGYIARLCWEIIKIVKRIIPLYMDSPAVRETLPLLPWEQRWLKECWLPSHHIRQPIIYRLDGDLPLASPRAARSALFFESNSVAVGGMLYAPVAESIIADATLRELYGRADMPPLERNHDTRLIIVKKLASHAKGIGRRGLTVGVIEDKSWETGITEFSSFVDYLRRSGIRAYLVDPRELAFKRGELCYRGKILDIIYRNFELRDIMPLEEEGVDLSALKEAFRRNQVVSSLSGEFDHKSLWELLSCEKFRSLFSKRQKDLLARHIPWTRLIYERRTTDQRGRDVDLLRFMQRNRERLVIKPNRHYGGIGVAIGFEQTPAQWDALIEKTLKKPGEWVVQIFIDNKVKRLPWFWGRGGVRILPMYTTYGFISTPHGFGMVGRACTCRVVNVGRGGALLSVFKLKGLSRI